MTIRNLGNFNGELRIGEIKMGKLKGKAKWKGVIEATGATVD